MIDESLIIPIKRLGPVDLFNGIDIDQTKYYIKLNCKPYIERICERHLAAWMKDGKIAKDCSLPLPSSADFIKEFIATDGDSDPTIQAKPSKVMGCRYHNLVGELTYAMVTCRPDISFATVKCAQASAAPAEIHFRVAKYRMRNLPCMDLSDGGKPTYSS